MRPCGISFKYFPENNSAALLQTEFISANCLPIAKGDGQVTRNKIDLEKFDAILHMDDPQFAEKLAAAIGVEPGETLHITTPQFERTDGLVVPPPDVDFAKIAELPADTLKALGCVEWDEPDAAGNVLWLYPHQWYDHIPEGLPVTCIDGTTEPFKRGETDDDMRDGVLAYGFNRQVHA